tara:strand:+ start:716 stop:1111 length:396 start_codon:yes stop_codon:yes gene_type:complete
MIRIVLLFAILIAILIIYKNYILKLKNKLFKVIKSTPENNVNNFNKLNYKFDSKQLKIPLNKNEAINLKNLIFQLSNGSPEDRLKAVQMAKEWGHISTLPILRKGLKDTDSRIVQLAALAIQKYKQSTFSE